MYKSILVVLLVFLSFQLLAQDKTVWNFDGQVQLRSELDGRDFSNKTYPLTFTSMRTRIGLNAAISDKICLYAQAQDSRIFGEEPNVTSSIKNLDLHQGFVRLIEPLDLPLSVQAGRFEMVYGTERFFGAGPWTYTGRSFDGVKFSFGKEFKLDLFALSTYQGTFYVTSAAPSAYNYPVKSDTSSSIYGFWFNDKLCSGNIIDVFSFYDISRKQTNNKDDDSKAATFGFNHTGNYGAFSSLTEGAYQTGRKAGIYLSAYLVSIQGFYEVDAFKAGLGADILSGSNPVNKDRNNTFYCLYGTTHRFYGSMDYFYKTPSTTYNRGLNDYYLTLKFAPKEYNFAFGANVHSLSANSRSLVSGLDLGKEVDLTASYNFVKRTTITWGGSLFFPGTLMKSYFNTSKGSRDDTSFWSYLMITANF
ncbi:MAG: alginate export family protein [Ignavibacteriaceae bacterium]|nr:alginate export family protein [Ignavibacteriaceae bacterium]